MILYYTHAILTDTIAISTKYYLYHLYNIQDLWVNFFLNLNKGIHI